MFIVKLGVALVMKQSSMEGSYGVMLATSQVSVSIFPISFPKLTFKVLLFVSNKRARSHIWRKLRGWLGLDQNTIPFFSNFVGVPFLNRAQVSPAPVNSVSPC